MDNVFQIGGQVAGASFLGRKEQLEYLRRVYLESTARTCKSIVGLTRVGKTSLARNVFQNVPADTILITEDLGEWSTYQELWQAIAFQLRDRLEAAGAWSVTLKENIDALAENEIHWIKLNRTVKKIFEELSERGMKTILVLDEFDYAATMFVETRHFELFRTLFSDARYAVSAMLLSRRSLHTIEGSTYQSSTFHGVVDEIPLIGFDDDDIEEYYQVFSDRGITLTEKQKESIEYYAGRLPFLLSIVGHYILECVQSGNSDTQGMDCDINIDEIFLDKCKSINDYYRDCVEHLKRDDDLKRLIPFVLGPNVGVTKNDKDELLRLGYLREVDGELMSISPYFRHFLSIEVMESSVWDNIINMEKKIKQLLEVEMIELIRHYRSGGKTLHDVQYGLLQSVKGIGKKDIDRYKIYISNNQKVFHIQSTYFDVMSLADAIKIVRDCWVDIFGCYFKENLYAAWEHKFVKCAKARNPVAHGHEEYLTELDKNEIDTYCKQFFDALADSKIVRPMPGLNDVLNAARKYPCPTKK